MVIRLASLALVLVIGGSVFAGIPLHSNEQECIMPEMASMDCCQKVVQAENLTPETSTARLCCALNCSQSGTSGSTGSRLPRPSTAQAIASYPSAETVIASTHSKIYSSWADNPTPYSNPAYIRHLALLI